jgi:outer membrane protein assembly factor BamB
MRQRILIAAALTAAWCSCGPLWAQRGDLIPEATAAQHGLTRPWFAQVQFDQGRGRVCDLILYEGVLYAQTDRGTIHAIDAETGKTLWSRQVGRPDHPSLTPSASHDLLATINGSRLYVVNRFTGDLLFEKEIEGVAGAGPALSAKRAYVPTVTGMIVAYRLDLSKETSREAAASAGTDVTSDQTTQHEEDRRQNVRLRQQYIPPLFCQSLGRAMVQPLVTHENLAEEYVAWATDVGYLNNRGWGYFHIGRINCQEEKSLELKFRLTTHAPAVARPAYLPPDPKVTGDSGLVIAASGDGYVYAIREKDGNTFWQFSTGEPVIEAPVVIETRLYVVSQLGGMYCLDIATGKDVWWAPNVLRFVAASQTRVYVVDGQGRILVLNAQNGARLDTLATESIPVKLANSDTDRIYLADGMGLIQCLHEVEQSQPLVHGLERKQAAEEKPAEDKAEKKQRAQSASKKEPATPKEPAAPKEPKAKKAGKKAADADADAGANPLIQGADAAGGDAPAKAGKAKKAKAAKNQP